MVTFYALNGRQGGFTRNYWCLHVISSLVPRRKKGIRASSPSTPARSFLPARIFPLRLGTRLHHFANMADDHRCYVTTTDLKNRTVSSIYCWKTEANGGHIGVTTWGVQWRHEKENENSDIFYLNMAAGGHSNMAAAGNNKSILWSPQNSLVIFTFKVVWENILAAF